MWGTRRRVKISYKIRAHRYRNIYTINIRKYNVIIERYNEEEQQIL